MQYNPLTVLPQDIQNDFGAELYSAIPAKMGVYRLVEARRTEGRSFEGQRITVLVVDENGTALPGIPVAFSYSTADKYTLTQDFDWQPPGPHRAFIVRTGGSGEIDQIQNDPIKAGGSGGITLYILQPEYSSDVLTGAGMLHDHTGLYLVYQLRRAGVVPLSEQLTSIEARLQALEAKKSGK